MRIEEMLKARGWSDDEIAVLAPSLTNDRLRRDLEESYGAVATERDQLKEKDAAWQRQLDDQWQPRVSAVEKEAQEARLEAARLREEVKIARDYGYITPEAEAKRNEAAAAATAATATGYDPTKHPTWEDVKKFGEAEGNAIALANDLNEEYRHLSGGKSLFEYETTINGQQMRGMRALRVEAQNSRKPIDQYIGEKFDFAGKRTALANQRQKEHDDAIRKEEADKVRNELASQYANPNMRFARPSLNPIVPAKPAGGKQPWEIPAAERKMQRIQRAMEVQMKSTPLVQ